MNGGAMSGEELQVKGVQLVHHAFEREPLFDEFLAAAAEALAQGRIAGQLHEPFGESIQVARSEQKTGFICEADFPRAVAVVNHHWTGCSQCLWQRARQALAPG